MKTSLFIVIALATDLHLSISMDFRKEWLKNRILNYFEETDENLFDIFLQRDNNFILEHLNAFLDDETDRVVDINKQVFIVYKTYYSKIIHEEIEIQEEVQRSSSFLSQDDKKRDKKSKRKKKPKKTKDIKVEEEDDEEDFIRHDDETSLDVITPDDVDDDDKQKKKKTRKVAKSGGRISPYTMMENLPIEEQSAKPKGTVSYIMVKKKVEKVVQVPQFQGYFGILDSDNIELLNYYVYFVKKVNRKIPNFSTIDEANMKMPSFFTIGSLTEDTLQNLEKILDLVYLPLYRNHCQTITEDKNNIEFDGITMRKRPSYYYLQKHTNSFNIMKEELSLTSNHLLHDQLANFIKPDIDKEWGECYNRLVDLVDIVKWARIQLKAEKFFQIPDTCYTFEWENSDVTETIVEECKNTLQGCVDKMDSEFNDILVYERTNENLISEYEHWKNLEIVLSSIVDELNSSLLNKIAGLVKINHLSLFDHFDTKRSALYQKYVSVKENADVLQTLQYFFKILMYSEFETISKSIPTLMDSLQTVWILSEYYREEENMERVLIDIKNTLCRRTKETFNVIDLFKKSWTDVEHNLGHAVLMLHTWKSSYLDVRLRIESTRDHFINRWEFSKQKLFSETDYISTVVDDIRTIFEVVESYRCLFASKFRKMTEQTVEFKNLEQKIINLTMPIEKVDFDIYLEIFRDEWQEILEIFQQDVVEVDQRLKILIIKTFSQIKSIKEGIEVVKNLSQIQTRPTVHESVPYICNKIIIHFVKEITLTDRLFEKNKLQHATVKIYDSITWANNLTGNLQKTTDCLQNVESLSSLTNFQEVLTLLDQFTSKAQTYGKKLFKEWCLLASSLIKDTLKDNLIEIAEAAKSVDLRKLVEIPKTSKNRDEKPFKFSTSNVPHNTEIGFGALSITLKWIARNRIIAESEIKNILSFDIVHRIHMTHPFAEQRLETMKQIEQAHKISWLEFVENFLLIEKGFRFKIKFQDDIFVIVKEAENLQKEGFKLPKEIIQLLSIKEELFKNVHNIGRVLKEYNAIVEQELEPARILLMKKYLQNMEMAIQPGLRLYDWKSTVLENYLKNISLKLDELICLQYQANEIFKKLDSNVNQMENLNFLPVKKISKNLQCEQFFQEMDTQQTQEAFKCLNIYHTISMTLIQIESLISLTSTGRSELMTFYYTNYSDRIVSVLIKSILSSISDLNCLMNGNLEVFFNIKIFLENNEIKSNPSCSQVFHFIKVATTRAFSRLKHLKQWEPGSCLSGVNSPEIFYQRVILDENVKLKSEQLLQNMQNLCDALKLYMMRWMIYDIQWKYDKKVIIKQFADRSPQLNDFEMRFDFYSNMADKIEQEKLTTTILCVNIETNQLIEQLKNHCYEWKCNLGAQLTLDTRLSVDRIFDLIQKKSISLNKEICNEDCLTETLQTINEIQRLSFTMELQFYKIQEHYHELMMQNFTVCDSDKQHFYELKKSWQELYDKSLYKKYSLEETRKELVYSMKQRISYFITECEEFVKSFAEEEANFKSLDFDSVVKSITSYSRRCAELYEKKRNLEIVQSCYEIAPFDFRFVTDIKNKLEELRREYKLLEE